jgi:hypothetical protein
LSKTQTFTIPGFSVSLSSSTPLPHTILTSKHKFSPEKNYFPDLAALKVGGPVLPHMPKTGPDKNNNAIRAKTNVADSLTTHTHHL